MKKLIIALLFIYLLSPYQNVQANPMDWEVTNVVFQTHTITCVPHDNIEGENEWTESLIEASVTFTVSAPGGTDELLFEFGTSFEIDDWTQNPVIASPTQLYPNPGHVKTYIMYWSGVPTKYMILRWGYIERFSEIELSCPTPTPKPTKEPTAVWVAPTSTPTPTFTPTPTVIFIPQFVMEIHKIKNQTIIYINGLYSYHIWDMRYH